MQSTGNDEPIPFSRVGDSGRIGLDRAQVVERFPSPVPCAPQGSWHGPAGRWHRSPGRYWSADETFAEIENFIGLGYRWANTTDPG
jgi:hypothetical protein